jgi:hypothetical protein
MSLKSHALFATKRPFLRRKREKVAAGQKKLKKLRSCREYSLEKPTGSSGLWLAT